jgi:effector-binding domain-containing protein
VFIIKWLFAAAVSLVIALFVYLYFYLGVYKSVQVSEGQRGAIYLLAKAHRGPYHQILPVIQSVEDWAREHNLPCPKTFGQYVDDPQVMDQDRLRSFGGCVMNAKVDGIPADFEWIVLEPATYVIAEFDGAPSIGPYKAYPAVKKYASDHRLKLTGPSYEFYEVNGENVHTEYLQAVH